ncbi:MAG: methyltransferase domain-containing protein [Promethearchaeati archaeon]
MDDLKKYAIQTLKDVGISKDQWVLDCCCGNGTYTIPAGELVGINGKVFAVDRNSSKLDDLKKKIKEKNLQNIEIIEEDVESGISLPKKVDIMLFYDIFWYFGAKEAKTVKLFEDMKKLAKENSLISVFPTHTSPNGVECFKKTMQKMGFILESEYNRKLVHENHIEKGILLNFRKKSE